MNNRNKKFNPFVLVIYLVFILYSINPLLAIVGFIAGVFLLIKNPKIFQSANIFQSKLSAVTKTVDDSEDEEESEIKPTIEIFNQPETYTVKTPIRLDRKKRYLHIALNSDLNEAKEIIGRLPTSDRILIEAGTPLIKAYGVEAISRIRDAAGDEAYIVADNKCSDLASREVQMMAKAGANAATVLGVAPIETIDAFIEECKKQGIDSIIDMMNVESSIEVMKKLKNPPNVVMLHRGVDETELSKEKQIPYYQIKQIKGNYNVLVAVAGGDSIREAQRAIFNDADIVVVWKNFYQSESDTADLARSFLEEIK